jgi:Xaa-Pro aminopeptidase
MQIPDRIAALRAAMASHGLDAVIIPTSDPHQSEYLAAHWKTRQWLTGFTGSYGTAVVTANHVGLWTDSRYFLQAEEQLKGTGIELHKLTIAHTPQHLDWMKENLPAGSKVGLDGRMFAVGSIRRMAKLFYSKNIELNTAIDVVGEIWKDRPNLPAEPVFQHDTQLSGATTAQRLQAVREKMGTADYYLLSTLDDIAWLLNLRGSDVASNPVFYAFLILAKDKAFLFMDPAKIPWEVKEKLNSDSILIKPYGEIADFLSQLPEGKKISLDLASTNNQVYNSIEKDRVMEVDNLVIPLKAVKNPVEIKHLRQVMERDGVALLRLFCWLEDTLTKRSIPETEVAEKLIELRRAQGNYHGESFDAIVGYQGNGAIVHYRPEPATCAHIKPEGILLLDSGGQYLDGTTDITRTIALSEPTLQQKRDFTMVLKGHIALATVVFPKGTTGVQLDTLARLPLWQDHLNYGHGTGHGVGFFLSVHEGPQGFSPVPHTPRANVTFEPGMLTSNEPGLYRDNQYGIRIENLVLCVEHGEDPVFGKFLCFDTVSWFPIDTALIEKSLLAPSEIAWLNQYHQKVYEKLSPHLTPEEERWLARKCAQI